MLELLGQIEAELKLEFEAKLDLEPVRWLKNNWLFTDLLFMSFRQNPPSSAHVIGGSGSGRGVKCGSGSSGALLRFANGEYTYEFWKTFSGQVFRIATHYILKFFHCFKQLVCIYQHRILN